MMFWFNLIQPNGGEIRQTHPKQLIHDRREDRSKYSAEYQRQLCSEVQRRKRAMWPAAV